MSHTRDERHVIALYRIEKAKNALDVIHKIMPWGTVHYRVHYVIMVEWMLKKNILKLVG